MPEYQYLIIGGGMTAHAAVKGIRSHDASGTIGMLTSEPHPPYKRPPLSKALWKGEPVDSVWLKEAMENVDIHLARTAKRIDKQTKSVTDDQGTVFSFSKLLLATGGTVRWLQFPVEGIIHFRTLDDYHRLRLLTETGNTFAVIGGGFIGSEVAAALAMNNKHVIMIFPEESIGVRVYPKRLSNFLNEYYRSKNVDLLANDGVEGIMKNGSQYRITTKSGKEFNVDGVVAGIGIQPNVDLAQSAGLKVDNGIVVDEFLQTSQPDIFAAGDVANFMNPALGKRIRLEHEDNATTMGGIAGKNMSGEKEPYRHLPFFYSDLFDLGYEAVGELDTRLEIVEDWKEEFKEGVVYYMSDGHVRGVLLWNTWGQVDNARKLIAEKGPLTAESVKGKLPV